MQTRERWEDEALAGPRCTVMAIVGLLAALACSSGIDVLPEGATPSPASTPIDARVSVGGSIDEARPYVTPTALVVTPSPGPAEPGVLPDGGPSAASPPSAEPDPSPAAVPTATPAPAPIDGVQALTVRAGDYLYAPRQQEARTGRIRVTFVNDGVDRHTFNLKNLDYRGELFNSPTVGPGETRVFEFEVAAPGSYVFFCILYGHQNKGQDGVLIVQR